MVVSTVLIVVYSYLCIRLLFKYFGLSQFWVFRRIQLLELFVFAVAISYIFNSFYNISNERSAFIVQSELLWIAFTVNSFIFGVSVGVQFILSLLDKMTTGMNIIFEANTKFYRTLSQVWVNVCAITSLFICTLLELPLQSSNDRSPFFSVIIYVLSSALGVLFYLANKKSETLVKRITFWWSFIIGISLIFIATYYSLDISSLVSLPITSSLISLIFSFTIAHLVTKIIMEIKARPFQVLPSKPTQYHNTEIESTECPRNYPLESRFGFIDTEGTSHSFQQKQIYRSIQNTPRVVPHKDTSQISLKSLKIN